jgi:hypothetical protein
VPTLILNGVYFKKQIIFSTFIDYHPISQVKNKYNFCLIYVLKLILNMVGMVDCRSTGQGSNLKYMQRREDISIRSCRSGTTGDSSDA